MAAAAVLLLGCSISFAAYSLALGTVDVGRWKSAEDEAKQLINDAGQLKTGAEQARTEFDGTRQIGQNLVGNVEGRIRWLELLKAVNACLPSDPPRKPTTMLAAVPIAERKELHVTNLDCQQTEDVSQWYAGVKQWDTRGGGGRAAALPVAARAGSRAPGRRAWFPRRRAARPRRPPPHLPPPLANAGEAGGPDAAAGPKGPGWIVQISGYHYHNADQKDHGAEYVRKTLIENLRNDKVKLPTSEPGVTEEVTMQELGISYPVLVNPPKLETDGVGQSQRRGGRGVRGLAQRRA